MKYTIKIKVEEINNSSIELVYIKIAKELNISLKESKANTTIVVSYTMLLDGSYVVSGFYKV